MIVRLPCFLVLRALLLIASRMEVSPIPVRALASLGDTASRSASGTLSVLSELVHHISPYRFAVTRCPRPAIPAQAIISRASLAQLGTAAAGYRTFLGSRRIDRRAAICFSEHSGHRSLIANCCRAPATWIPAICTNGTFGHEIIFAARLFLLAALF
jgi:hypothetical protein